MIVCGGYVCSSTTYCGVFASHFALFNFDCWRWPENLLGKKDEVCIISFRHTATQHSSFAFDYLISLRCYYVWFSKFYFYLLNSSIGLLCYFIIHFLFIQSVFSLTNPVQLFSNTHKFIIVYLKVIIKINVQNTTHILSFGLMLLPPVYFIMNCVYVSILVGYCLW